MSGELFDRPLVVLAAVLYLLVVSVIGLVSLRRTRTARDFFIAGQRVGLVPIGLATMSTAFSGFVFLGGPGLTYRIGLASLMIVLPVGLTGGLLCWVVGRRLRMLAGVREIYTIADVLACRFDSRAVSGLAAFAIVLGTVAYLGLQLQVLGILLAAVFDLRSPALAIAVGLGVIVLYSAAGGMVAGVYTDVVQGILMLIAAIAVFVHALGVSGGWVAVTESIRNNEAFGPSFLEPLGRVGVFTAFGFFFVFCVGVLGQPQVLHKFYMLSKPHQLRWLPLVLGSSQALCLLIWIGIGLAVPALVSQGRMEALTRPDDAAPRFLLHHTPDLLAGLAFAAILAAVMSTADSLLNIGSAALVRDLPRALRRPVRDELGWGRIAVLVIGGLAALIAWSHGALVALLGTFAFGMFGAALAPVLSVGLNWPRVTARAAAASIVTGMTLHLVLELMARKGDLAWVPDLPLPEGVLPAAVSLAASFVVLFVISASSRTDGAEIDRDVRRVMET